MADGANMKYVNERTGLALLAIILGIKGMYDWHTQHPVIIALDFGIAWACLYILKHKINEYQNKKWLLNDEVSK